jgi:hypothetical protein
VTIATHAASDGIAPAANPRHSGMASAALLRWGRGMGVAYMSDPLGGLVLKNVDEARLFFP